METKTNPQNNPQEQDTLFFNVMPKARIKAPILSSAEIAAQPQQAQQTQGPKQNWSKMLKILGIIILIAACGVSGYYGYGAWKKSKSSTPPVAPPPADATIPPPTAPIATTTSPEWLKQYFNVESCTDEAMCGDSADPDQDGLNNKEEEQNATDPKNPDTDGEGLADGDEIHIFGGSPTNTKSAGNSEYTDGDDAKGGYDTTNKGEKLTPERLASIAAKIKEFGLHEPSLTTLSGFLDKYQEVPPAPEIEGIDNSPEAKLDRDTERLNTMKKLGIALTTYHKDTGFYPVTDQFSEMLVKIKAYNNVATNPADPINQPPYVYNYNAVDGGKDFLLTYYSETQNQQIRYTRQNAAKDAASESANLNDDQRVRHLENIRQALLIYSAANVAGSQTYVFPTQEKFVTDLVPQYLDELPKDPASGKNYEYAVSQTFDSFAIKTTLENPPAGNTGYQCTQEGCNNY